MYRLDSHADSHLPHCNIFKVYLHSHKTTSRVQKDTNTEAGDCQIMLAISHLSLKIYDSYTIRGAPSVSRLTNCISACPQDKFVLPVQEKPNQKVFRFMCWSSAVERVRSLTGVQFSLFSVHNINHSQSCSILWQPGLGFVSIKSENLYCYIVLKKKYFLLLSPTAFEMALLP